MKIRDYWHDLTWAAVEQQKIKPVVFYPVEINIKCQWKARRRRDIDSLYVKAIFDSLVETGILEDDSSGFVNRVTIEGEIGAPKNMVTIVINTKLIENV